MMDAMSLLRTVGALGLVLGVLVGALWIVRRYDINVPGRTGGGKRRRLEIVERLSLDSKRSVALIRRDGREHLILIGPEGNVMIETAIQADAAAAAESADDSCARPGLAGLMPEFGALVERAKVRPRERGQPEITRHWSHRRLTGVAKRAARRVAAGA